MDTSPAPRSHAAPVLVPQRRLRVRRAMRFLDAQRVPELGFASYVSADGDFHRRSVSPPEVFSEMLIAGALADGGIVSEGRATMLRVVKRAFTTEGLVHFFHDKELLPADLDCTAVALALLVDHDICTNVDPHAVLDRMAGNTNRAGVVTVYVSDEARANRVDPAVCVNVLYAFYLLGRGAELEETEAYVESFIESEGWA